MNLSYSNESGPMTYRADIDGLRALAVLAVISFHLNFGLPGGFIGVDIFFVISGYLITGITVAGIRSRSFSALEFYARRARRILPGLISTLIASSIAAGTILYPPQLIAFAKSAIAAVLFSANIHFLAVSGYFAPAAEAIPLLHLWSLGIEEQFYILFPAIALLCARGSRKLYPVVLIALCAASLVASQLMLGKDPALAFYLLPFRGYELLMGCLLALPAARSRFKSGPGSQAAALAGAALVIGPVLFFGPATAYPGLPAAIPALGTALIIKAGEARSTMISKLLSARLLVGIGKISYSLYLVHCAGDRLWSSNFPDYVTDPVRPLRSRGLIPPGAAQLSLRRTAVSPERMAAVSGADAFSLRGDDRLPLRVIRMDCPGRRVCLGNGQENQPSARLSRLRS